MKSLLIIFCISIIACKKQPFYIDTPTISYIDQATNSDTIIVNYNIEHNTLQGPIYYANKGWQPSTSSTPQNGFKQYGIRFSDSVYLPISPNVTIYNSYYFKFSSDGSILESQNLLLPPSLSNKQTFVRQ